MKPLNHLDFLREKDEIAKKLNLHSLQTPATRFDQNYQLLEQHQRRQVSTDLVVDNIRRQLQTAGRYLSAEDIRSLLVDYVTVRHMEFHPTDVCNLSCQGCTYGHDDESTKPAPVNYPYDAIKKVAQLRPRSVVIIGGGEPTLYRSGSRRFQDVVDALDAACPGVTLALTTNGTFKPEGPWPDRLAWIRLSLDAATPATYAAFRGKRQFDRVLRNFLGYLDHAVPQVGISFLYSKANIHEYASVTKLIHDMVTAERPDALHKVNIQYRPLRRDPYQNHLPFTGAVDAHDIARTVADVVELAGTSAEMTRFMREQTNIAAILGGNSHPPHDFERCHYSQTFKIVRANGDLRPCFIRVVEPDFMLGNLLKDNPETIALNTLYIGARRKPDCDAQGCRQCHVNYTFEKGLSGELEPPAAPAVMADPMY
jgi:MoaA/NifB/PqqE/SkfB family radical SAM enzyme